jgi:hypothetical protein
MSGRAAPFYCPYCGDEDLRPSEQAVVSTGAGHGGRGSTGGTWECAACNRAFQLTFLGLLARGVSRTAVPQASAVGEDGHRHSGPGGDDRI